MIDTLVDLKKENAKVDLLNDSLYFEISYKYDTLLNNKSCSKDPNIDYLLDLLILNKVRLKPPIRLRFKLFKSYYVSQIDLLKYESDWYFNYVNITDRKNKIKLSFNKGKLTTKIFE